MFVMDQRPIPEPFASALSESRRRCSECGDAFEDYMNNLEVGIPTTCLACWSEFHCETGARWYVALRGAK